MSTGALAGAVMVPFFGALLCITPAITRPTVPFGVRVPAERSRLRAADPALRGRPGHPRYHSLSRRPGRLPAVRRRGPRSGAATDRDDDRFWKAGLVYLNHDDPAIMVGAGFGVGWTFNVANPMAWPVIAGIVAAPVGLAAIIAAAGL